MTPKQFEAMRFGLSESNQFMVTLSNMGSHPHGVRYRSLPNSRLAKAMDLLPMSQSRWAFECRPEFLDTTWHLGKCSPLLLDDLSVTKCKLCPLEVGPVPQGGRDDSTCSTRNQEE
jgi:hypothetical protein